MNTFEGEKYLVEIHEKYLRRSFIGNGLIGVYPDGNRVLLTAEHVAFDDQTAINVVVKTHPDLQEPLPQEIKFKRRVGEDGKKEWGDVVEMKLPPGEGIPIALRPLSDQFMVRASLHGHRADVPVKMRNIGVTKNEQGQINLNSPILHVVGLDMHKTIYPGFSGSGIYNDDGSVVALASYIIRGTQPTEASGFVIMTPRAGKLEE